jgi:hypothetical protein
VLGEAGLSTREVANQVGHARIGQTQDYMARRIASERAAEALGGPALVDERRSRTARIVLGAAD